MNINDLIIELKKINNNDIDIKIAYDSFLEYVKIHNRINTFDYYKRALDNILSIIKVKSIQEINEKIINKYILSCRKKNISNNTINKRIEVLKIFNNYLIRNNYITSSYISNIKRLKSVDNETIIIENDIIDKIFNYMDKLDPCNKINIRNKAIIYLFYDSGIRETELLNIKFSEFKPSFKYIDLHYTKSGKNRKAFLTDKSVEILNQYITSFNINGGFLFRTKDNKQITKRAIDNLLQKIKSDLNIKSSISSHKFRHTLATKLLINGMTLYDVSKVLGHSSVTITQKYLHITDKALQENYNKYVTKTKL